jgi:uncharacterized protein YecT (DUF1311 family)
MKTRFIIALIVCMSVNFGVAQTQMEMNDEAAANYQKADKELNAVYNQILKEYASDPAFIKNLKVSESIWIKFRDAEMKTKYPEREDHYYGSMHPVCAYNYLESLTVKRTDDLKPWLIGVEEGDGCGGSIKTN